MSFDLNFASFIVKCSGPDDICCGHDLLTACWCAVFYRNPLSRVRKLLDSKHDGHYMLFNLCSERYYEASKFGTGAQVACFPFEDHQVQHRPHSFETTVTSVFWLNHTNCNLFCYVHCPTFIANLIYWQRDWQSVRAHLLTKIDSMACRPHHYL